MDVVIEYTALLRREAGTGRETVALTDGATLGDLVAMVAARHGVRFAGMLQAPAGGLAPTIVAFVDGAQVSDLATPLRSGGEVTFLSPISGG